MRIIKSNSFLIFSGVLANNRHLPLVKSYGHGHACTRTRFSKSKIVTWKGKTTTNALPFNAAKINGF